MKFTEAYEHLENGKTLTLAGVTITRYGNKYRFCRGSGIREKDLDGIAFLHECFTTGDWATGDVHVIDNRVLPELPEGCSWVRPGDKDSAFERLYIQSHGEVEGEFMTITNELQKQSLTRRLAGVTQEKAIYEALLSEFRTRKENE